MSTMPTWKPPIIIIAKMSILHIIAILLQFNIKNVSQKSNLEANFA